MHIETREIAGFHLPAEERHLTAHLEAGPMYFGRGTYQFAKLKAAVDCIPPDRRRGALDIGGHCGLWGWPLSHMFEMVLAFEPLPVHAELYRRNVPGVRLIETALGAKSGETTLYWDPENTGSTMIAAGSDRVRQAFTVSVAALDSFTMPVPVDFIKIDAEGAEHAICLGAEKTLRLFKPVVIVEQKPGKGAAFAVDDLAAVRLLESWGMKIAKEIVGDFIMIWPS